MENDPETTESHRYSLARLFVAGFFLLIFAALLGEIFLDYSGVYNLAAIFGGWVTAVLGFYFLQQKVEHSQRRERNATTLAENAKAEAARSKGKRLKMVTSGAETLLELKKSLNEHQKFIEELINELRNRKGVERNTDGEESR